MDTYGIIAVNIAIILTLLMLKLKPDNFLMGNLISELLSVACHIWDHTIQLVTRHKQTHPAIAPASTARFRPTYPWGMEGWVGLDWGDTPARRRKSKRSKVRRPNRYQIFRLW